MKNFQDIKVKFLTIIILILVSIQVYSQSDKSSEGSKKMKYVSKIDSTLKSFKDAKFGMFIHFGVENKSDFNPKNFNAGEWAHIAKEAGMKYVVLTSKHHAGFCLWDSKLTDWNIVDQTPYKRDIVKDLAVGCKETGLDLGFYYSIADYHHPLYEPKYQNRAERKIGTIPGADISKYIDYMFGQLEELSQLYQPNLIWFDGGSGFRNSADKPLLRRQELVDMLHSYGTISNSRLGDDDSLSIVDYLSMNDNLAPPFNLGVYFESAVTIGDSWHFSAEDEFKTTKELLERLVNAVGNDGNLLLNVGPNDEGAIPKEMVSRLKTMGKWLEKNGEAIYGTEAGPYTHEISWGSITQRQEKDKTNLYLNVVDWPNTEEFTLFGLNNKVLAASLLETGDVLNFESRFDAASGENIIKIKIPKIAPNDYVSVIKLTVAGAPVMETDFFQLSDGKVVLETYNANIHDVEYIPNKPSKAIDMKMFTVPQKGEGVMPFRGLSVTGFQSKGQALNWDFKMYKPGAYEVVVVCHAERNKEWNMEGRVRANVAGQSVENELIEQKRVTIPTTDPSLVDLYASLGTININSAGAHTLTLEVSSDFIGTIPNFRSVMLIPVQK